MLKKFRYLDYSSWDCGTYSPPIRECAIAPDQVVSAHPVTRSRYNGSVVEVLMKNGGKYDVLCTLDDFFKTLTCGV